MKKQNGFTLIELLIGMALMAIVLAIGVPSFQTTIENNRLATQANDFISALNIARSESAKRGTRVTVCKSSDGSSCSAGAAGYEVGWIIFVDVDGNGARSAGSEELLKRGYGLASGYTLRGSAANAIDEFITFRPSGRSSATGTGKFALCKDGQSAKSRTVVVEYTGRTHVEKDASVACG